MIMICTTSPALSKEFKTADDVIISYEVTGKGEALLMLHSGMMSREDMRVQIDYFSEFYKVIAIDAREQGHSSSSTKQITYELMVNDAVQLLDHLNIKKTNIFGQSDGGVTALLIAHYHPNRVNKLIIHGAVYNYNGYPKSQREGWKNITWDSNNESETDPEGFPGMTFKHYLRGRSDLSNFEKHLQEMAKMWASSPNLTKEDLQNIKTPTLVIVGDHYDISIPHTVEMYEALNNSQLFIAPGATHYIHQEIPDLLHKVLHDFLKK